MTNVWIHYEFVPIDCVDLYKVHTIQMIKDEVEMKFVLPSICSCTSMT
jgi:hypothetical protein